MKNYLYILLLSGLVLSGLNSCTDLDETVYDSIVLEETKFTQKDIPNIMAPAYTALRDVYWGWNSLFDISEECADLIVTPGRENGWGDLYIDMHKHTWDSYIDHGAGLWARCYTGINNANRAIEFLNQIKTPESNFDNYFAQLRGLRAYYYYLLLDHFRNVPIVTQFKTPVGYLPDQNTAQEVYNFIESELKEVMPQLSEENNADTYGKFTKWAAKMVLAKIYLNAEVYLGTAKWNDALAQVNDVIQSDKFSKAASYADPFLAENAASVEEIFSIPFDEVYAAGSYYHKKSLHPDGKATYKMSDAWGGSCGIPQFLDTYDPDDERLKVSWLAGVQFSSTGDTIKTDKKIPLVYTNYLTDIAATKMNEGYRFVKYQIRVGVQGNLGNDVPLFRYSDALMIKAECLLRTGKKDEAAVIVSDIRARAFKAKPSKAAVTGDDLLMDSKYNYGAYVYNVDTKTATVTKSANDLVPIQYGRFLDELAWEFVGEHHRRQDLIRFGVFTQKSWYAHKPNGDYRVIFPIPYDQRSSNSKLNQNPGYTD